EQALLELQRRLEDMEARAEQKAASEASLAIELERFKSASAEALDLARTEVEDLQAELSRREKAIREAEANRSTNETAIHEMQRQLEETRTRAEAKAASEARLVVELESIRAASAEALELARVEMETL